MSNVIGFLEKVGQDARLRHASRDEVELALAAEQMSPELQIAILAKDQPRLETLLGRSHFCCVMFPVKEGEEESEESPSRDDEQISSRNGFGAVALAG
jgi:hypothetical protein